ncbi:MAG TPA: NRDE family protein [Blastocatellia bacterium]|nr:NRDE family protein [Blastocatellia bacterium]
MCTVSWLHCDSGYQLFCNRDERHTRGRAAPPQLHQRAGVRFIAPTDGDHGGSWIGVNEFGLSLCLLNRYQDEALQPLQPTVSRGLLLTALMDSDSPAQVSCRMKQNELTRFQPFTLLALAIGRPALIIHWTGRELFADSDAEAQMPLTSSSYETARVVECRQQQFAGLKQQAGKITADLLLKFHRSHAPERGPYSTCMHRADAATVSFSRISIADGVIQFDYHSAAPCTLGAQASRLLKLREHPI